jgi:rare lipoprotein A
MIRRAITHLGALLAVSAVALTLPALVLAASGGASPGRGSPGGGSGSGQAGNSSPQVQPGNTTVTATGGGITFGTRESGLLRSPQRFSGDAGSSDAGDIVEIERRGRETGWQWARTAHATVGADGSFAATWPANHIGRFAIRAVLERGTNAGTAAASPAVTITVYRPSLATQYGPGFYGHQTACGIRLRPGTIGVANRTLKCGTPVAVYYRGRTMIVPVIDRGPYAHGADWDLTEATGRALGIDGTATVGAVSLPGAR